MRNNLECADLHQQKVSDRDFEKFTRKTSREFVHIILILYGVPTAEWIRGGLIGMPLARLNH